MLSLLVLPLIFLSTNKSLSEALSGLRLLTRNPALGRIALTRW
jgi:hypothetical protein